MLLDELSSLGQVSVEDLGTGSLRVTFGGPGDPPLVDDTAVNFPPALSAPERPPRRAAPASRRAGRARSTPTGPSSTRVARTLADAVNAVHSSGGGGNFFSFTDGAEAGSLAVAVTPATVRTSVTADKGANDLALRMTTLRGGAADQAYGAFVARVGSRGRARPTAQQANAQALTDAVDDRRQSVAGVSLDEEMTSLIRFQRAYQASSRAMSTMDEMLDVLINRTGQGVGST